MTTAQILVGILKEHSVFRQSAHFVEVTIILRKNASKGKGKVKEKARTVEISSHRHTERPPRKCFRCGSEDQMIAKCPKPSEDNEK